jgi:hypothetical protein
MLIQSIRWVGHSVFVLASHVACRVSGLQPSQHVRICCRRARCCCCHLASLPTRLAARAFTDASGVLGLEAAMIIAAAFPGSTSGLLTRRLRPLCFVAHTFHVACSIPDARTVSARARALPLPLRDQFPASAELIIDMRGDHFPWLGPAPAHARQGTPPLLAWGKRGCATPVTPTSGEAFGRHGLHLQMGWTVIVSAL